MNRIHTPLAQILKDRIRSQGPLTFRDFMAVALYDSIHGFYAQGPEIGSPKGPFDTNAKFPSFAFALAQAVLRAEPLLSGVPTIVELGGGTGQLAGNLKKFLPEDYEYVICEPSPRLRMAQETKGVRTVEVLNEIRSGRMVVFGNEVLDALPVHRVMGTGNEGVLELYVNLDDDGEFFEDAGPVSTSGILQRLEEERITLGRGQVGEICLEIQSLLENLQNIVNPGFIFFVDYGDSASNVYSYRNRNGTLRAYFQQQQIHDPFYAVGQQDLTADVDFTAVISQAKAVGWQYIGSLPQGNWLKNLGIEKYRGLESNNDTVRQELEMLTGVASLGSAFDILMFATPGMTDAPGFATS